MTKIVETSLAVRKEALNSSFSTSLRSVSELDVIEFHIKTDDGYCVFGETVATPAITGHTLSTIQSDLSGTLTTAILNKDFELPGDFYRDHVQAETATTSAKSAVDLALYELAATIQAKTLPDLLECTVSEVKSDVTLPLSGVDDIPQLLAARSEFTSFKVKLSGEEMEIRVEKIQLIRDIVGSNCGIRVDPNQAWSVKESIKFLEAVEHRGLNIEYLEQPVSAQNKKGLAQIRAQSNTRIMADESIFTILDLEQLVQLNAVDLINIKIIKSGGITPALEIISRAEQLGIDFSIGTMMEGDKGVLAAVLLAGAYKSDYCHDLDAAWWATNSILKYRKGRVYI
ncbi:MAG: enolase C-terminal domain-like protein [Candidatus Planktophila sp.]|nr:enolase C-terminal domain-like protein [Candidatus Planktophila sp.]